MRTDRDGAPLASVAAEDVAARVDEAGVSEQLTALLFRDQASGVEAACEWMPGDVERDPYWLVHLRHPDDPTTYTARAPDDLQAVRRVVAELLPLATELDQARMRQGEAEARLVRAVQATRGGAP